MIDIAKFNELIEKEVEGVNEVEIPGEKIKVCDGEVYYIKVGHGPKIVFVAPGTFGSIYTTFPYLIDIDKEQFTIIFWDPPGYGKSRPPLKNFEGNFYKKEADMAHEFFEALGIKKYSLLGFCGSGMMSLIHAAKYSNNVEKLVIWGAKAYITQEEIEFCNNFKDFKNWPPRILISRLKIYGEKYLQEMTDNFTKAMNENFGPDGNICKDYLKDIQCPTLVLHGAKDILLPRFHYEYLCANIKNVTKLEYPEGPHYLHLKCREEFCKTVEKFLLEP